MVCWIGLADSDLLGLGVLHVSDGVADSHRTFEELVEKSDFIRIVIRIVDSQ